MGMGHDIGNWQLCKFATNNAARFISLCGVDGAPHPSTAELEQKRHDSLAPLRQKSPKSYWNANPPIWRRVSVQ
jgi:hypothetical protein